MIFERATPKVRPVVFASLSSGANFMYGGELFLKVINPDANNNAVGLEVGGRLWKFDKETPVVPINVKIIEVVNDNA